MFKVHLVNAQCVDNDSNSLSAADIPVTTYQSNIRLFRQDFHTPTMDSATPTIMSRTVLALALPVTYDVTKLFVSDKLGLPEFQPPTKVIFMNPNESVETSDVQLVAFNFDNIEDAKKFYDCNHGRWLEEGRYQSICLKLVFASPIEEVVTSTNPPPPPPTAAAAPTSPSPTTFSSPSSHSPSSSSPPPLAAAAEEEDDEQVVPNSMMLHTDAAPSPDILVELPNCSICLDRLDPSIAGVGPGVCVHQFITKELSIGVSCDCWKVINKVNCRVCSILDQMSSSSPSSSSSTKVSKVSCEVCNTEDRLWTCLVCGYVGCGRYTAEVNISGFIYFHRVTLNPKYLL
jgi:hypothetical protein